MSLSPSPAFAPWGIPDALADDALDDVEDAGADDDVEDDVVDEPAAAAPEADEVVEEPPPQAARRRAAATMEAASQARGRLIRVVDIFSDLCSRDIRYFHLRPRGRRCYRHPHRRHCSAVYRWPAAGVAERRW